MDDKPKTIKEIIKKYLQENGYDGLYFREMECFCYVDHDFMPCDEPCIECKPGHKFIKDDGDSGIRCSEKTLRYFGYVYIPPEMAELCKQHQNILDRLARETDIELLGKLANGQKLITDWIVK